MRELRRVRCARDGTTCIEIGESQSGLVSATMNTIGQVGGMLSPIVLAWLVERSGAAGQWLLPLQIIAVLGVAPVAAASSLTGARKIQLVHVHAATIPFSEKAEARLVWPE